MAVVAAVALMEPMSPCELMRCTNHKNMEKRKNKNMRVKLNVPTGVKNG